MSPSGALRRAPNGLAASAAITPPSSGIQAGPASPSAIRAISGLQQRRVAAPWPTPARRGAQQADGDGPGESLLDPSERPEPEPVPERPKSRKRLGKR